MFLKINENFGFDLYSSLGHTFFYVVVIIAFLFVVSSIVSKDRIFSVIGSIVCFSVIVYMFLNPDSFVFLGDVVFSSFMDLLNDLNYGGSSV